MTTEAKTVKRERNQHSAQERCQAVLAVWTERRRPSEICRELGIEAGLLLHWQNKAMIGMLRALEPRTRTAQDKGPALGLRVQKLLQRTAGLRDGRLAKLAQRLEKLQQNRPEAKEPVTK